MFDTSKFESAVSNVTNPVKSIIGGIKGGISSLFKNAFPGLDQLIGTGVSVDSVTQQLTIDVQKRGGLGAGQSPEMIDPVSGINRIVGKKKIPAKNIDDEMSKNNIKAAQNVTYPPQLAHSSYFIEIQFGEYKRPYFNSGGIANFEPVYTVNLPLPPELVDGGGLGWSTGGQGMTGLAMNVAGDAIKNFTKSAAATNVSFQSFKDLAEKTFTEENLKTAALGALYAGSQFFKPSFLGVDVSNAIQGVIGAAPNPFPGAFYVGPEMRSFGFNWQFIPENHDEMMTVKSMIREIRAKTLSTPTDKNAMFLKYPHICKIKLHPEAFFKEMFPIKVCVLSGININYAPYGLSFHPDKNPTAITLALQFAEIEPLFSEDFGGPEFAPVLELTPEEKPNTPDPTPTPTLTNQSSKPPATSPAPGASNMTMNLNLGGNFTADSDAAAIAAGINAAGQTAQSAQAAQVKANRWSAGVTGTSALIPRSR